MVPFIESAAQVLTLRLLLGLAFPERNPPLFLETGKSRALAAVASADPQFAANLSCEGSNNLSPQALAGAERPPTEAALRGRLRNHAVAFDLMG
jgi:hypothetical protein